MEAYVTLLWPQSLIYSCCHPQPSVIEANAVSAKTLCLLRVKVAAFPMFTARACGSEEIG